MKRVIALFLAIVVLVFSGTESLASEIEEQYASILQEWNATDSEELWSCILTSWWKKNKNSSEKQDDVPSWPLQIRFGGNTNELISSKKKWDLAIVSSKDIDLQALADKGLIMSSGYVPSDSLALVQWLYPEAVKSILPIHPILMYKIYCYDYDYLSDNATLLICQADIGAKKNSPRFPDLCAQEILSKRSVEQIRSVEGINRVRWSTEQLIEHNTEWDVATLIIECADDLSTLVHAEILYDFSTDPYWSSRTMDWPVPNSVEDSDGKIVGIPFVSFGNIGIDNAKSYRVMLVNSNSENVDLSLKYVKHLIKSYEWLYHHDTPIEIVEKYGISIYKDQVDW